MQAYSKSSIPVVDTSSEAKCLQSTHCSDDVAHRRSTRNGGGCTPAARHTNGRTVGGSGADRSYLALGWHADTAAYIIPGPPSPSLARQTAITTTSPSKYLVPSVAAFTPRRRFTFLQAIANTGRSFPVVFKNFLFI